MVNKNSRFGGNSGNTRRRMIPELSWCKRQGFIRKTSNDFSHFTKSNNNSTNADRASDVLEASMQHNYGLRADNSILYSINKRKRWSLLSTLNESFSEEYNQQLGDLTEENRVVVVQRGNACPLACHSKCHNAIEFPTPAKRSRASKSWKRHVNHLVEEPGLASVVYDIYTPTDGNQQPFHRDGRSTSRKDTLRKCRRINASSFKKMMQDYDSEVMDDWDEDYGVGDHDTLEDATRCVLSDASDNVTGLNNSAESNVRCGSSGSDNRPSLTLGDFIMQREGGKRQRRKQNTLQVQTCDDEDDKGNGVYVRKGVLPALDDSSSASSITSDDGDWVDVNADLLRESPPPTEEYINVPPCDSNVPSYTDHSLGDAEYVLPGVFIVESTVTPQFLGKTFKTAYVEGISVPCQFAICLNVIERRIKGLAFLVFTFDDSLNIVEGESCRMATLKVVLSSPSTGPVCDAVFTQLKPVRPLRTDNVVGLFVNELMSQCDSTSTPTVKEATVKCGPLVHRLSKWQTKTMTAEDVILEIIERNTSVNTCNSQHLTSRSVRNFDLFASVVELDVVIADSSDLVCPVCFCVVKKVSEMLYNESTCLRSCKHWVCNACWVSYVAVRVEQGRGGDTRCPVDRCNEQADIVMMLSFVKPCNVQQYFDSVVTDTVNVQSDFRYCPQDKCELILHCKDFVAGTLASGQRPKYVVKDIPYAVCACRYASCFDCGRKAHWPAVCCAVEGYDEFLKESVGVVLDERGHDYSVSVEMKRCPRCHQAIEKGYGCNHMTCICGFEFCWRCRQPIKAHTQEKCVESVARTRVFSSLDVYGRNRTSKNCMKAVLYRTKWKAMEKRLTQKLKPFGKWCDADESNEFTAHAAFVAALYATSLDLLKDGYSLLENLMVAKLASQSRHADAKIMMFCSRLDFILQRLNDCLQDAVSSGLKDNVKRMLHYHEQARYVFDRLVKWKSWV